MTKNQWKRKLDRLLEIFEIESTISLSKINHHFYGLGQPFDDKFREYFLDKSTQRLNTSFDIVRFDGCSKTPIQVTPSASSSKQAANVPVKVKIRRNAFSESNNHTESFEDKYIDTDWDTENMIGAFEKRELNRLLEIFELESTISLSKINHHFERLDRPFDNEFRDYFLEMSTQRLNTSFDIVQFDGCSKISIRPIQKSTASKQAVDVPKEAQSRSKASQKSNNHTDLDIKNFVETFVKSEFNVGSEAAHLSKTINDNTGGKPDLNGTSQKTIDLKNVSHQTTSEKNDCAKVSEPLENLRENILAQMQQPIDSIVKLYNFECKDCDYATNTKYSFTRHQKIHDFQKLYGIKQDPITGSFECPHCDQKFIKWYGFKYHLTMKHRRNQASHKCKHCLLEFVDEAKKDRHEAKHHSKNINGNTGRKQEFNVTSLKAIDSKSVRHENTSKNRDRAKVSQMQPSLHSIVKLFNYKCNDCDYATNKKSNLDKHQKIHDFQKLYGIVQDPITKLFQCSHCDRQFTKWYSLRHHLTLRGNRPSYKCERCLRLFDDEIKRDRHVVRCTGHRFECYLCKQYTTYNMKAVQEHMRTHSGAQPLKCRICDMSFRHEKSLLRHLNVIHKHASQLVT